MRSSVSLVKSLGVSQMVEHKVNCMTQKFVFECP